MPVSQSREQGLLSVREAATILNVFECWVRRHKSELPVVRVGGLIRFDEALLRRGLACKISSRSRWNREEKQCLIRFSGGNEVLFIKQANESKRGTASGAKMFWMPTAR